MKLLPLACFAASTAQFSGDYEYGGVDTAEDERGYSSYGNYDDYGNKKKNKNNNYFTFSGRTGNRSYAVALNCWPANFDRDNLVAQQTTEANPKENHLFGPLHLYGSEMNRAGNTAFTGGNDPGLRSSLGGHYQYGHRHSGSVENSTPSEWAPYHSARHAGCLYEADDFTYNANTWDHVFHLWYFNGYYKKDPTGTTRTTSKIAATAEATYVPNWVHFFNAHVLPGSSAIGNTQPDSQTAGTEVKLVIANPQYEGLGFLNFVATYRNNGFSIGQAYQEFADTTHVTNTPTQLAASLGATDADHTYATINTPSTYQQTQGITGNYYFDAWMGTWELQLQTTVYTQVYAHSGSATSFSGGSFALSSFPNNELGKDFRFNIRCLLQETGNTARNMYYFYKINTITITFPEYVAYALVHDGREGTDSGTVHDGGETRATDVYAQGEGLYNVKYNNIRKNIIPPLDLGSHFNNNGHSSSFTGPHENTPLTPEYHRIQGYLSGAEADVVKAGVTTGADFCEAQTVFCDHFDEDCNIDNFEELCSKKFIITGLMNTYSERLGGQRGSYQEIWVQLQYAMKVSISNALVDDSDVDRISSPFPYLHFMAYQVSSVVGVCDTYNVINGNDCAAWEEYTSHDFGFGG